VAGTRAAQFQPIAPPVREGGPNLQVYVIFTDFEGTRRALKAAAQLARDLETRFVLLAAQVVPYPLPIDDPPVSTEFTERVLSQLVSEQETEVSVKLYLCRDRKETIRSALGPDSLVVLGTRSRWWPSREWMLARLLRRDGHKVVYADIR
jgi:hypothetical protein